jgi:hypothetical protein
MGIMIYPGNPSNIKMFKNALLGLIKAIFDWRMKYRNI